MTTATKALLKKESPLREIWKKGLIPIKTPLVKYRKRGAQDIPFYEVDLDSCTPEQVDKILEKGREIHKIDLTRELLFDNGFLISLNHTEGFTMSMGIPT